VASLNALWALAVVQELVHAGVRHAVVAPGARSAPLALAFAEATPGLSVHSVVDERTAGFFALGLALETGHPSAVVVTSGTAGAHLLPSLMEAWAAHVPLVALTANRPWELHGFGAPQTVPQEGLFGRFTRMAVALPVPEANSTAMVHLRAVVARAVAASQGAPRGPVHLDIPFREPLARGPDEPALEALVPLAKEGRAGPFLAWPAPARLPPEETLLGLRRRLSSTEKGLVVVGPHAPAEGLARAVAQLAASYGYPVVADAASNLRWAGAGRVVGHGDVLVRSEALGTALRPDLVLRLGGGLTSKRLGQWLDASGAVTVVLAEDDTAADANHAASLVLAGDASATCVALSASAAARPSVWAETFFAADARADAALAEAFAEEGAFSEPQLSHRLLSSLPKGTRLVLASSMPIRDVDAFSPNAAEGVRVLANRGVNGIDGTLSTALGVAATSDAPTVVLLGDLAFLHDLGGLLIAKRCKVPLTVVVANNDGGAIFSFLPVAQVGPAFEPLFATPHGLELSHAAALFGASYRKVATASEVTAAVQVSLRGGLHLIEAALPSRTANVALHHALFERAVRAAEGAL